MTMKAADFGDDFTWGVASAAFQIEGAWNVDGKAPSVWDEAGRRGRIRGGRVGDDAIDAYHRFDDDLDTIAGLGFRANRFSISWPRVYGNGRGPWNAAGGDFYDRVIDAGLERGLEPWVTVHHWDLPLALQREGAWARRGIVEDFAAFAEELARRYGDRVKHWMVFNEPASVLGHTVSRPAHPVRSAPGRGAEDHPPHQPGLRRGGPADAGRPRRRRVDRHRQRARPSRRRSRPTIRGCDEPSGRTRPWPFGCSWIRPAAWGIRSTTTPLLRPMRRFIEDGDLEAVAFDYDFMGMQYYGPIPLKRAPIPGLGGIPTMVERGAEANVRSAVGLPVEPKGLLETLRRYRDHPACRRMVITENGFGMNDRLVSDGPGREARIRDDLRIWYVRTHLEVVRQAIAEGIPVDGYFYWSYADNIEWVLGRGPRFGLLHIDYEDDLRRREKDSARWFRRLLTDPDGVD